MLLHDKTEVKVFQNYDNDKENLIIKGFDNE